LFDFFLLIFFRIALFILEIFNTLVKIEPFACYLILAP